MKLWRKSALIAPAVIIAMTAAACGGGSDTGGGGDNSGTKTGGQMVYGLDTAFPDNLMPLISAGNSISTGYTQIRRAAGAVPHLPGLHRQAGQRPGRG